MKISLSVRVDFSPCHSSFIFSTLNKEAGCQAFAVHVTRQKSLKKHVLVSILHQTTTDAQTKYRGCREQEFSYYTAPCKHFETILSILASSAQNFSSYTWKIEQKRRVFAPWPCTSSLVGLAQKPRGLAKTPGRSHHRFPAHTHVCCCIPQI